MIINDREKKIRKWFAMWLSKEDTGIMELFSPNAVYIESWGPEYHGSSTIKHWFDEWNSRGQVFKWEIKQFFHCGNQTVVDWYFENRMSNGVKDSFDGLSLVVWTEDGKIQSLKEYGCNIDRYNPYAAGEKPVFKDDKTLWF